VAFGLAFGWDSHYRCCKALSFKVFNGVFIVRIPDASFKTLTTTEWLVFFNIKYADVAELADALDLGLLSASRLAKT